jgi:hypothetical protein
MVATGDAAPLDGTHFVLRVNGARSAPLAWNASAADVAAALAGDAALRGALGPVAVRALPCRARGCGWEIAALDARPPSAPAVAAGAGDAVALGGAGTSAPTLGRELDVALEIVTPPSASAAVPLLDAHATLVRPAASLAGALRIGVAAPSHTPRWTPLLDVAATPAAIEDALNALLAPLSALARPVERVERELAWPATAGDAASSAPSTATSAGG